MKPRATEPRAARLVRTFAFPIALGGVVACAAVLGIDDRVPEDDGPNAEGGNDAPSAEASIDALADGNVDAADAADSRPPKKCAQTTCRDAGGSCTNGECAFLCADASCNGPAPVLCPQGTDCTLACNGKDNCAGVQCVGGKSCTLNCDGENACKGGATCTSNECTFNCGNSSCKGGTLVCDASVCIANCTGTGSCDKGANFTAPQACMITCSGASSCKADMLPLHCLSEKSSIDCVSPTSCAVGVPWCQGSLTSECNLHCNDASTSCTKGTCCEAGTCDQTPGKLHNCK